MRKNPTLAELAEDLAPETKQLDDDIAALIAERPANGPHIQWVLRAIHSGAVQPKELDAAASVLLHFGVTLADEHLIAVAARLARASMDVDTLARAHAEAQSLDDISRIPPWADPDADPEDEGRG
jgi:hypothetical protein